MSKSYGLLSIFLRPVGVCFFAASLGNEVIGHGLMSQAWNATHWKKSTEIVVSY